MDDKDYKDRKEKMGKTVPIILVFRGERGRLEVCSTRSSRGWR